jgi:hypothetical protein
MDYCSQSEGEQRQNLDYGPLLAFGVGVLVSGFWICALLMVAISFPNVGWSRSARTPQAPSYRPFRVSLTPPAVF